MELLGLVVGALIPTAILSRLWLWVLKRWLEAQPRILLAAVLTWICSLIDVRGGSHAAFERILAQAGARNVGVAEFFERWERRNIEQYWGPYRPYREICTASLADTFASFGLRGDPRLVEHYFDAFGGFRLFDDVLPTLERPGGHAKLAIVSNIDDDLLALTPLGRAFDLVCTAERARGYKPDGTLFRYLIEQAG